MTVLDAITETLPAKSQLTEIPITESLMWEFGRFFIGRNSIIYNWFGLSHFEFNHWDDRLL
jgi:hypothetical protein